MGAFWSVIAAAGLVAAAAAMAGPAPAATVEEQSRALERAARATVGVAAVAVEDARSIATLGPLRSGSGVLIGADGLILTVGYLVLEADDVEVTTADDRHFPARVVAYDVATGFGLVQALAPLQTLPAPLGSSAGLGREDGLVIMSGGEDGGATPARLVARRPFSGFWEYHLDDALFTAPQRADHSGAGLFNLQGELLGIGSLAVNDALQEEGHALPGNLFLPIDLLKPVLAELQAHGRTRASARPWLGLNCAEVDGQIRVLRVNSDSPADVAGLQPGDRIVQVDERPVSRLEELWKQVWAGDRAERDIRLEIDRNDHRETLVVHAVDREKTLRRPQGV